MSVNYASGLSPFADKGECGQLESFDTPEAVESKCAQLAAWIEEARGAVVVHTGAGISTSCGIPDFRGPKGVWTLEQRGEEPTGAISFGQARPSLTHMALVALEEAGWIRAVITQNVDGLNLRSGFPRNRLAILHGDMFIEECDLCHCQFARPISVPTMGLKRTGNRCGRSRPNVAGRCRGHLRDTILDWEDALPDTDLNFAREQASNATLSLCLGSSLQIVPGGELPLLTKPRRRKRGRRSVARNGPEGDGIANENGNSTTTATETPTRRIAIVNLQPTKRDKDCDLKIHAYVDQVMRRVCETLGVGIPTWSRPRVVLKSKHTQPIEKYRWNLILPDDDDADKEEPPCKTVKVEAESKTDRPLSPCAPKETKIEPKEEVKEEMKNSNKVEYESKVESEDPIVENS